MPPVQNPIPSRNVVRRHAAKRGPQLAVSPSRTIDDEEEDDGPPGFLQYCWPAIFGILLAVITQQVWDKVATSWGDLGLRLVYPFVLLSGRPELGFSEEMTKNLPQLLMYLQFPLEGLLVSFSLRRRMKFSTAMSQIVFLHAIGAFVLWLLTKPGASHGL